MKCEQCGRRARRLRTSCFYCGGKIAVEQKEAGPLSCSACGTQMEEQEHHTVVIDVCPKCSCIWLDIGELEVILQQQLLVRSTNTSAGTLVKATPQGGGRYRKCPHCFKFMSQQNYKRMSGVIVDVCNLHGAFLDAGEIQQIQQFLATGGEQRVYQRELEDNLQTERAKRIAKLRAKRKTKFDGT